MKTRILFILPFCLVMTGAMSGCKKDNLPEGLEWSVLNNPSKLPLMDDQVALVYEVMVKNTSIDSYAFEWVSVKDGSLTLQNLSGNELDTIISVYHSTQKSLRAGETAFFYMWVNTSTNLPLPESLTQTIQFNRVSDGKQYTREIKVSEDQHHRNIQ